MGSVDVKLKEKSMKLLHSMIFQPLSFHSPSCNGTSDIVATAYEFKWASSALRSDAFNPLVIHPNWLGERGVTPLKPIRGVLSTALCYLYKLESPVFLFPPTPTYLSLPDSSLFSLKSVWKCLKENREE